MVNEGDMTHFEMNVAVNLGNCDPFQGCIEFQSHNGDIVVLGIARNVHIARDIVSCRDVSFRCHGNNSVYERWNDNSRGAAIHGAPAEAPAVTPDGATAPAATPAATAAPRRGE